MTHRREESVVRMRYQSGMMIISVEDLIWDIVHMPPTAQNQTHAADNRTGTFAKFFDSAVHNVQPSRNEWMCGSHETAPASVCVSFLSTVMVMTSNTNPLDWDYSSSRAAAGRREVEDWTSLACLPVSFFLWHWLHDLISEVSSLLLTETSRWHLSSPTTIFLYSRVFFFADDVFRLLAGTPVTSVTHHISSSCLSPALCPCLCC